MIKHPLLVLTADKSACCWLLANFWKNCVYPDTLLFLWEKMNFHHAFGEGHSACTALTQITDNWLK
jgi:hypothetical protein